MDYHNILAWIISFFILFASGIGFSYPDETISPGKKMLEKIVDAVWQERHGILDLAMEELLLDDEDDLHAWTDDVTGGTQDVSCQQCRVQCTCLT